MNPCIFIIFSLCLLLSEPTTANQLVAVGGGRDHKGDVNTCSNKEKLALLDLKIGLQDPNGCLPTWKAEDDDCCKWSRVTCNNETGHVTELELWHCGFGGEITDSLLNLTSLNHLQLSFNSFQGTIPTFIGSMTQLRYLDLSANGFNGIIPASLGSLTELRYLDLSDNSLYGTIPIEFGNLTNLQWLLLESVGRCRVENLEWLSHLSQLQRLVMDGISLAKANDWVNVVVGLRKLTDLSLRGCELSKVMYPYFSVVNSSSSSVELLDLENNNLTSSMYSWLLPLTSSKLRFLILSSNVLDGIPKYFGNLCSLECLRFDSNSAVVNFPDFLNNLSGCTSLTLQWLSASGSEFTGSLTDEIQNFSSLEYLCLSHNHLNGTISEKLWELPKLETLDVSFNYLRGAISVNIGNSKVSIIDLSKNSLEGVPSIDHLSNLSYAEAIDLSSCELGPHFPVWIQSLKHLTRLDISNTRISDTIPLEFWDMWPSRLHYFNLSSNNISGKVPDLSSNFDYGSVIDLSSNNFHGPIPNVSSTVASLNLSKNKFYGGISFLCQIVDGFLQVLDLSHNFLTGQLPDCLWNFKQLKVLNLGHNNLFGRLPTSFESLTELKVLYLFENNFFGELTLSFKNCTSLNSLNLGGNKFSGNVPVWIGENLSGLYVLILRSNNFSGTMPIQLCQLENLQILDMSINNLHGNIPSCLNNLTSMVQEGFTQVHNLQYDYSSYFHLGRDGVAYADHAVVEWLGDEREFISNLRFLKSIDLSSNNFTGQIPYEITKLYGLIALNLSENALLGEIPWQIGHMKNLLALDLSRNKLSGGLPSSMSQMTFLDYLDVSCNNLSGRIPSSTQLQSFEPARYDGNVGLCGPPLLKRCRGDEFEVPPVIGESKGDVEDIDKLWDGSILVGAQVLLLDFGWHVGLYLSTAEGDVVFLCFLIA